MSDVSATDPPDEMIPLLERAGEYLARIFRFPFDWGLPDQTLEVTDYRRRFFRYDADRFRHLIIGAEHIIRCLIIWKAYRKMRDEDVTPRRYIPPPHNPNPSPREPAAPMHHLFEIRGLPLHEPKPPPFRISLPDVHSRSSPRTQGSPGEQPDSRVRRNERKDSFEQPLYDGFARPESRSKRKRNDDIAFHEKLYLRMERLSDLYESLDDRAARLASRWSGQLLSEQDEPIAVSSRAADMAAEETEKYLDAGPAPPSRKAEERGVACHSAVPVSHCEDRDPGDVGGFHERGEGAAALSPGCFPRQRTGVSIKPLKSHDPPPDTLRHAPEDMAQDIHTLHDVAIRTADAFADLCVDTKTAHSRECGNLEQA